MEGRLGSVNIKFIPRKEKVADCESFGKVIPTYILSVNGLNDGIMV